MAYIYKITNVINNKMYIGKTEHENPYKRWKEHIRDSKKKRNKNRALYKAINLYGIDNFKFEIIEETNTPEDREIYYISLYDTFGKNGYNLTIGGDGKCFKDINDKALKEYYPAHCLVETQKHFNVDKDTLKRILKEHNIKIVSQKIQAQNKIGKKVKQIDMSTNHVIDIYNSCSEPEVIFGGRNNGHISKVCRGIRKSAYGYYWEFVD